MLRSVMQQVEADLRNRIFAGRWSLGMRIYEEALAAEFHVSRGPVREALRLLQQEGLVTHLAHRGTFVVQPSEADMAEMTDLRALLEGHAVEVGRAAQRPVPREELLHYSAEMRRGIAAQDYLAVVQADLHFHGCLVDSAGQRLLSRKFHDLDGQVALLFHSVIHRLPDRLLAMPQRHEALVPVLSRADVTRSLAAVHSHYTEAAAVLKDAMTWTVALGD